MGLVVVFAVLAWTEPFMRQLVGSLLAALFGLAATVVLIPWIRYPANFTVVFHDDRIEQPLAPGQPTLAWGDVALVETALGGGVWLSAADRKRRIRLWPELDHFPDLLELTLTRANIPAPELPFEIGTSARKWWIESSCLLMFLLLPVYVLQAHGPDRLFWMSSAFFVFVSACALRTYRNAPARVRLDAGALRIWSRSESNEYPLSSIRTVHLVLSRHGAIVPLLITNGGESVSVPVFKGGNSFSIYLALTTHLRQSRGAAQQRLAADADLAALDPRR